MIIGKQRKWLLCLVMILLMILGMALTAHASGILKIGGKTVETGDYDVYSYDAGSNTLTLKTGTIEYDGIRNNPVIWYSGSDTLSIVLAGSTTVKQSVPLYSQLSWLYDKLKSYYDKDLNTIAEELGLDFELISKYLGIDLSVIYSLAGMKLRDFCKKYDLSKEKIIDILTDDRTAISIVSGNAVISGDGTMEVYGSGLEGIYCANDLYINSGSIYANGGDSKLLNSYSILCGGNLTINGGRIVADAGLSLLNNSYGIYCEHNVTIKGGSVSAYGGKAVLSKRSSYGIYAKGNTIIESGVDAVLAIGYSQAVNGSVSSQEVGYGWATTDKSDDPTTIAAGTYGSLAYRQVQFPVEIDVTDVVLDKTALTLTEGDVQTLTATVLPADATDQSLTWSSDNENVAKVDAAGKVTAVAEGKATIAVKTASGSIAKCTVTVLAKGTVPQNETNNNGNGGNGGNSGNGGTSGNGGNSENSGSNSSSGSNGTNGGGSTAESSNASASSGTTSAQSTAVTVNTDPFVRVSSILHTDKTVKLAWDAVPGADGYDVFAGFESSAFKNQPAQSVTQTIAILDKVYGKYGLKKVNKNIIKYQISAYKIVNGQKQYIAKSLVNHTVGTHHKTYSDAKKIVVQKSQYTLKVGKNAKLKVKVKTRGGKKQVSKVKGVRYISSNKNLAAA